MKLAIETETIEYKRSTSELKSAMDSIAAILNKHNKGVIYFGVKNDGEVIGQDVSDKTLRDISQAIANHIEPRIYPNISVVRFDDLPVITVEFEGYDTPYLSYGVGKIRVADEDRSMDVKELIRFIKDKSNENNWEKQISDISIDKVNVEDLKDYISKANKAKRIDFEFNDVESSLDKLSLIKDKKLLNAGMVLFSESIYSELQMAVFATEQRLTFLDIDRKRGTIFDLVTTAEDYIKRNINWNVEFDGSMERKEIPEIPIEAIREALINSFAHKDYGACQTNEVAIYKDRVEIYNPGTFPDEHEPEEYVSGNLRPIRRNPLITSVLYYSKDMESFGTGLKRISDLCNKANCKYEFEKQKYGFVVKFFRNDLYGTIQDTIQDKNRENAILNLCKTPKSSEEIQNFVGIKSKKYLIKKILRPLLLSNKLNMTIPENPNNRNQKYFSTKTAIENSAVISSDTIQDTCKEKAILNYCKDPKSREEIQKYIGIADRKHLTNAILNPLLESNKLKMTIPDKPNSKNQRYFSSNEDFNNTKNISIDKLPTILQDKNKEKAILNYCKDPKSREEIQKYIGIADRKHLTNAILNPLLESNKLKMTIPDKPNSKNQRYFSLKISNKK